MVNRSLLVSETAPVLPLKAAPIAVSPLIVAATAERSGAGRSSSAIHA